ncbi:MAG: ATP-dependent Clp protease proteolytic subunit, partial [Pseudomonadota bacterium]|nr:ATP-dependent Clp protease proteolytic subunit [Pseudomonadota bacterium]
KRFALPSASVMVHQPSAGTQGTVTDMTIAVNEFQRLKDYLNGCLAKHTGHDVKKIEADLERDNFKSAQDAESYNLVDHVVTTRADMKKITGVPAAKP